MKGTDLWTLGVIVGLGLITMITRSFFFMSNKPWGMPAWVERGLQYAPIAALTGVIAPEILMTQGHLVGTWLDARLFAAAAGVMWYFWQRRSPWALLGTTVTGMLVYLPLHLGLGW
jgi:branched-subunit amino acid transport protein